MRRPFLPAKVYPDVIKEIENDAADSFLKESREEIYAAAMTEMGLCRTTSQLTRYTNPFGELQVQFFFKAFFGP